jgi:hypothetical protein
MKSGKPEYYRTGRASGSGWLKGAVAKTLGSRRGLNRHCLIHLLRIESETKYYNLSVHGNSAMRTQPITILCVVLFVIGASMAIRFLFQFLLSADLGSFLMLVLSLIALFSYYGLWRMRRWSLMAIPVIWGIILLVTLFSAREMTTIIQLRSLYPIGIILVFLIVVSPSLKRFSGNKKKDSSQS